MMKPVLALLAAGVLVAAAGAVPARAADPAKPAEPAKAAEPAKPAEPAKAAEPAASTEPPEALPPPHQQWAFEGVFGTYDRAALQRGFQVYKEVCSACHPVKHLYYRDLTDIGYTEDQVKGFAAQTQVTDGPNDQGEMFQRPGRPSDKFAEPFENDQKARVANNGALPPDLSLIIKARDHGPDYVYALLTGFKDAPAGFTLNPNMNYNPYFAGHQIGMPPPLTADGQLTYADGTPATVAQMAHDAVIFLSWASEPTLDERHRMGAKVILFLAVVAGLFYAAKRRIWAALH